MNQKHKSEYISRVNKSIDYIQQNISKQLALKDIARVACFSEFHFHRIFKAIVGETLNSFVRRVRVEKAAIMLDMNEYSMTEVALKCGFSSSQTFARAFRSHFKMSPGEYKSKNSKIRNINSKKRQDFTLSVDYDNAADGPQLVFKSLTQSNMKVEIQNLDDMMVAYLRHIGPYQGDSSVFERMFTNLCKWAGPRNLFGPNTSFMSLYHDDPKVTEKKNLRFDVCLTVPVDTEVSDEVGKQKIEGGEYAVAYFEMKDPSEYEVAWNALYKDWFPTSGYQPADKPPFERYLNDPKSDPNGMHKVEICIPVKPM